MTLFTKNFQLEYLAPNEPAYLTRDVLQRMTESVDAALTRGGIAPAEVQVLTGIPARATALEGRATALEGRATALEAPAIRQVTLAAPGWVHTGTHDRLHVTVTGTEVRLRGTVKNGAALTANAASTVIPAGGLPAGCRPAGPTMRSAVSVFGSGNWYPHRVDVAANGSVTLTPGAAFGVDTYFLFDLTFPNVAIPTT